MSERTLWPADAATQWWRGLQDQFENGQPNPRADRAARARLRRASLAEALTDPAFFALHTRLFPSDRRVDRLRASARVALVLAHVRDDDRQRPFGRTIGAPEFDKENEAPLKPLRFKRLLQARDDEDVVREFRRAVDLAGGKTNVRDLAHLLLDWADDKRGETARARLAFDYYAASEAAAALS